MTELEKALEVVWGYLDLGMSEDAWDELESLPPEDKATLIVIEYRVTILHRMEKWEAARMISESMVFQMPEHPCWWLMWAYSLRHEQSPEAGYGVLLHAVEAHPDFAMIPFTLAGYMCHFGDLAGARELLRKAFALEPELRVRALDEPDLEALFGEVNSLAGAQ